MWSKGHELMNMFLVMNTNTNISLCTYTCTSYFQEHNVVYNKYENVNIMSY